MILLHNPSCSTSRAALAELKLRGFTPIIRLYLEQPLNQLELLELLAQLKLAPLDLVRQKEALWQELSAGRTLNDTDIIDLLVHHPKLIERPILIHQNKAAIGRPLEKLLNLIN